MPSRRRASAPRSRISSATRARAWRRSSTWPGTAGGSRWFTGTAPRWATSWPGTRSRPIRWSRCRSARWRRLAPSPRPVAIVEREMVRHLVSAGHIVVACGGGGPPVDDDPKLRLEGIDAVADKDLVAAILGRDIGADVLLILTNVDAVFRAYGTPHQQPIRRMDLAQAEPPLSGEDLGTGNMRPKVEAAATVLRAGGERATIAQVAHGLVALRGEARTTLSMAGP